MSPPTAASLESVPAEEADAIARIQKLQLLFMKRDETQRGQHPKCTGFVRMRFAVRSDVPDALKLGVFSEARVFDGVIRFSNGALFDDREADARGAALKLIGAGGPRAVPEDRGSSQDFLLVNCPVFFCRDVVSLLEFMQAQLKARGEPPTEWLTAHPHEAACLKRFLGPPPPSLLATEFHSATPYSLGNQAVKYCLRPVAAGEVVQMNKTADGLSESLYAELGRGPARFVFGVRVQSSAETEPVEDPTLEWTGEFVPLADVEVPAGQTDSEARRALAERLYFSPWNARDVHRPLGGINRARRPVYAASSEKRHAKSGVAASELLLEELP